MASTARHHRRLAAALAAACTTLLPLAVAATRDHAWPAPAHRPFVPVGDGDDGPVGWDGRALAHREATDAIAASFTQRSYPAGATARLALFDATRGGTVQLFRAGTGSDGPMQGSPIRPPTAFGAHARTLALPIGPLGTGLYYARLASGTRVGYAPFVVQPGRPDAHRVAVVLPTNTWQAYNFRDDDGNGVPNTWYASASVRCVGLVRPFLGDGVPPHYVYDRGFERWLVKTGKHVDVLTDDDLDRLSGAQLARRYDLVVFPGHQEYVTAREMAAVTGFRDRGGNLAFLSANNLFREVTYQGGQECLVGRFRDLGDPEAAVIGAQYVDWNHDRYPNRPFVVCGVGRAPWLFRGTGLRDGARFGVYGIEIDARSTSSPSGTEVLAHIPDAFGPGESAEMTYYTTSHGAKVFDAGVINFGSSALWPVTSRLLQNLWAHLARP